MFEDVVQLILRNTGSQGYSTLYSSSEVEIDDELLPYLLPRVKTSPSFPNYFFKYPINHDFTLIKLVQDDGVDEYNRFKAKVVLFIVPKTIYEENNGLLFFASPLWLHTISLEKNNPLDYTKDFDTAQLVKKEFETKTNISFLAFLLDKMLFYDNLIIMIDDRGNLEKDRIFLMQALAYLDYKLPSFLRNQITIKTLANKEYNFANVLLLDHYDKSIMLGENYYVLSFTNKVLSKEFVFESSNLAKKIVSSKSGEELEIISRSMFNSKMILKNDLVSQEQYNKLVTKFNIKNTKILTRFFRNFNLR